MKATFNKNSPEIIKKKSVSTKSKDINKNFDDCKEKAFCPKHNKALFYGRSCVTPPFTCSVYLNN